MKPTSITTGFATAAVLLIVLVPETVSAGPIAFGLCQTACNAGYGTRLGGLGYVAGAFALGLGIPAAVTACSVIQGSCMVACAPFVVAPSP